MTERRHGESDEDGLSRGDDDVLDAVYRAIGGSELGFDDAVLRALYDALRARVPLDAMTVSVDEPDGQGFRVFARFAATSAITAPFPNGARVACDRRAEGLPEVDAEPRPVIVEIVGERGSPLDRQLYEAGVRSYVSVPMPSDDPAWLTVVHAEPGAPSQRAMDLLVRVARALASFARARMVMRAKLLATLVDASPDGMIALDLTYVVREVNRSALKLLDRRRRDVIGRPLADVLGEVPSRSIVEALARGTGDVVALAISARVGDVELPIDAMVGEALGSSAEAHYHLHLRDARERRVAEDAMARRLEHLSFLRALAESLGSDLRVQIAIERALDVCIARRPIRAIAALRAEDAGFLRLVATRAAPSELVAALAWIAREELEALRLEGCWSLLVPLSHARRTWGALFVVGRDASPLPDTERELWDSVGNTVSAALHAAQDFEHVVELEAENRALVDSLPVVVARVEPAIAWSTSFVNGAAEQILGVPAVELHGLPGLDGMLDPADRLAARAARIRASQGDTIGWEDRRYRHKDGRLLTLREVAYPVHDMEGTVRSVQILAYDVTTEIESRRRLLQADRLASLGALAAGIAHEINNPVAFIGLAAGQIPRQSDPARVTELAREISEAADSIAHIVGELKLFTRIPDGASSTPVDVSRMLETAVTLTSAEIRRRARLDVSLADLPLAPGRFSSLGQAFVNLLLNGAQAAERAPAGRPRVVTVRSRAHGDAIVVEFTDTGPGILPEHLPRVFDPFFAPDAGAGSAGHGLGLAIAYDLVRRAGGDIRVTSTPGEGTTFEVSLELDAPASVDDERGPARLMTYEKPALSVGPGEAGGPDGGLRPRVLIIDDEHALAKALARQLAARYVVDTASTAADALAQLSVHAYDAVVCDLRMPDQSGPSIYAAVRGRSAGQAARFIFTTGGSYGLDDDEMHERARATGRPVLEKPFDGASFEAAVAEVASRA